MSAKLTDQLISQTDSGNLSTKLVTAPMQKEYALSSKKLTKIRVNHTPDQIAKELRIDERGRLWWKVPKKGRRLNKEAGSMHSGGYLSVRLDGKLYFAHHLAWCLYYSKWPAQVIDHINGIPWDNSKENLRDITAAVNAANRHTTCNRLKHRNVYSTPGGKYQVKFMRDYETVYIGTYASLEEAIKSQKIAESNLNPR